MTRNPKKTGGPKTIRETLQSASQDNSARAETGETALPPLPSPREIEGTRAKTLTAAMRILAEKGVEELSLRAIADSAGIGLASIYHYFANKEELLLHLALTGFHELRQDIAHYQSLPEHAPRMRASALAFFNFVTKKQALFSLMFDERLMARHEALREAERLTLLAYRNAVAEDDRISPEHQENAAHAIWAMGRGIAATISSYPPGATPPKLVEKMLAGGAYLIYRTETE